MANRGPDTGGSQFFLMIEDAPLPADYAVFGEVTCRLRCHRGDGRRADGPQSGGRDSEPAPGDRST